MYHPKLVKYKTLDLKFVRVVVIITRNNQPAAVRDTKSTESSGITSSESSYPTPLDVTAPQKIYREAKMVFKIKSKEEHLAWLNSFYIW